MHRPITRLLVLAVAFVLAPSVMLVPSARSAGAQEGAPVFEGVVPEILEAVTGGDGQPVRPYLFTFEQRYASIPWDGAVWVPGDPPHSFIASQHPIAIQVLRGEFAFEVAEGELAIVDPRGEQIRILTRIEPEPYYELANPEQVIPDCTTVCAIPADTPVQLNEGAIVYLPAGVPCFWCRFREEVGSLRVFVFHDPGFAPENFEWFNGTGIQDQAAAATPTARRWRFNPPTHCH